VKYRLFYKGEEVRASDDVCDKRMRGRICTVVAVHPEIQGEHRYTVITPSGMSTTVVESLLLQPLGRWEDGAWQPKREAR
jgi:hypothetical protein